MEGSRTSFPLLRDVGRFALEPASLIPLGHGLFKCFGFGFWFLEVFCFGLFFYLLCASSTTGYTMVEKQIITSALVEFTGKDRY